MSKFYLFNVSIQKSYDSTEDLRLTIRNLESFFFFRSIKLVLHGEDTRHVAPFIMTICNSLITSFELKSVVLRGHTSKFQVEFIVSNSI